MRFPRHLCSPRLLLGLLLLTGVLVAVVTNVWAWYQLRSARTALEHNHPESAQLHLNRYLRIWPSSITGLLLASRAARQQADFLEADRQLRACQVSQGGSSEDIALEWALLQAAVGNTGEVEDYLQKRLEQDPILAPLVWEALGEGYIRGYRILDAMACLDHWLRLQPENPRALELRGLAYQNGKSAHKGAEDFRRVLELDPTRDSARWALILSLLDMGAFDEAMPHLQHISQARPNDPDVLVRLARCHNMLGRNTEARQLLDELLVSHPEHGLALRTRGQFALADRQPSQAEKWLERAVAVWPNDYQSQWLLFQALQQQNRTAEANARLKIAEEVKGRAERLGELTTRKLAEQPLDPGLHYELGVLMLRSGNGPAGEMWLKRSLELDPGYRPAHAALAEYYRKGGDRERSRQHSRKAEAAEAGAEAPP